MNTCFRYRSRSVSGRVGALAIVLLASAPCCLPRAQAAGDERGDWSGSLSVGGLGQSEADLDDGGQVKRSAAMLALSAHRQFSPNFSIGGGLRYEYDRWDFDHPAAFGDVAPWKNIRRLSFGLQIRTQVNDTWDLIVAPMAQYAGEQGAKSSDALRYGSALAFARSFGPDLQLGLGVVALHDIDKNRVLPYVDLSWKINERWRFGSSKSAMPAGLGALELVYQRDPRWSFGVGIGVGENRFRLDEHGPMAGAAVEWTSTPLYGRLSFRPNRALSLDAYLGTTFRNELKIERAGLPDIKEKYDAAPIFGVSMSYSP